MNDDDAYLQLSCTMTLQPGFTFDVPLLRRLWDCQEHFKCVKFSLEREDTLSSVPSRYSLHQDFPTTALVTLQRKQGRSSFTLRSMPSAEISVSASSKAPDNLSVRQE